ncbi:hypothetical protein EYR40_003713 [Pleurotus pulmonarius]|nr:hypothetical protein EYR40_003713 [Pleurotus pulmonarius]KAF4606425.1 hypothetical protein EYR38_000479 [Pleurotus pulmonarius]
MLSSWRKHDDKGTNDAQEPTAGKGNSLEVTGTTIDDPIVDDDEKYRKRATTTAISTPHDAVLAELQSSHAHPNVDLSARIEEQGFPELLVGLDAPFQDSEYVQRTYMPDQLQDPFTGAPLGILAAGSEAKTNLFSLRHQDMWTHLSKVLELQGEIAKLHIDMEGITASGGLSGGPGKGSGTSNQRSKMSWDLDHGKALNIRRDTLPTKAGEPGPEGDGEDMDVGVEEDEEATKKKAREEEFANLASKFEGRKAKVDAIMDKLGDLSKALTEFHALQAPVLSFSGSSTPHHPSAPPLERVSKPRVFPVSTTSTTEEIEPTRDFTHGGNVPELSSMGAKSLSRIKTANVLTGFPPGIYHPPGITDSPKSMGSLIDPET